MQSSYQALGIPDSISATFTALFLILTLSSWAAGQDFGIFKIPNFSDSAKRRLKFIGPLLLTSSLLAFIPFWSKNDGLNAKEDVTWKRNYQLFASRPFPEGVVNSIYPDSPEYGGLKIAFKPNLLRDLNLLILTDDKTLETSRNNLIELVRNASIWNNRNPTTIIVDSNVEETYIQFKNLLRAAAVKHGVDVERLERERYIPPD